MINKRNQQIGIEMQEKIATLLEKHLPNYLIISNGTRGPDLIVTDQKGVQLEVEVKTAKELFWHNSKGKKRPMRRGLRRGIFNILPDQLDHDLFVFVVRFVDVIDNQTICNGDIEIWYALGRYVKAYLKTQTLNCLNYKLCIDKLPLVNAKDSFEIYNEFLKLKKKHRNENFGFMRILKEPLLKGSKNRTNRADTPFRDKCGIGSIMHIFVGLRTKNSEKVFDARVIEKVHWDINDSPEDLSMAKILKSPFKDETWEEFALKDGFNSYQDFLNYFKKHPKKTSAFICFKFIKI